MWYRGLGSIPSFKYEEVQIVFIDFGKNKYSTPVGFELTHTLYTALAGQRLNHSARVPCLGDGSETPIEYKYHLRFEKYFTQRRGNAETEDLTS